MSVKQDLFQSPDYFLVDELLTDEHKMIRDAVRTYVKKEISPIIEDYAQRAEFPQQIVLGLDARDGRIPWRRALRCRHQAVD